MTTTERERNVSSSSICVACMMRWFIGCYRWAARPHSPCRQRAQCWHASSCASAACRDARVCILPVAATAGAIYELFSYYYNLGHVSNAVALWLGMRPADVFVFVFLPPFLLDLSVRIDYFMLNKASRPAATRLHKCT